jgi:hypothetical protein
MFMCIECICYIILCYTILYVNQILITNSLILILIDDDRQRSCVFRLLVHILMHEFDGKLNPFQLVLPHILAHHHDIMLLIFAFSQI